MENTWQNMKCTTSKQLIYSWRILVNTRPTIGQHLAEIRQTMLNEKESTHVRAIALNRQALIVKRKKAARYFRFSSCFEFITSSDLSHVGPCCVLGHFQLSKNNDAFSAVLSWPSIWRCLVFSELLFQSVAPKKIPSCSQATCFWTLAASSTLLSSLILIHADKIACSAEALWIECPAL